MAIMARTFLREMHVYIKTGLLEEFNHCRRGSRALRTNCLSGRS